MSDNTEIVLDEKIKNEIKEPGRYKVVFLNDDATPMDFVVSVLMEIFRHSESSAIDITNKIHTEGSGIVGIYTHEIAEQKAMETTGVARNAGFPLQVKLDQE